MPSSFLEQHERALAASEYDEYLLRLKSTHRLAIVSWLLYIALDAFASRMTSRATFLDFLGVRLVGCALACAALFVLERVKRPPRLLARMLDVWLFLSAGILVGLLCSWLDGLKSPYLVGLAFIISCRSILLRERWFTNVLSILPSVAGFVGALLLAGLHYGTARQQLTDPFAVGYFVINVVVCTSVAAFSAFAGDALWRLERAAFEGQSLGRFKLEARVGAGAMGEIWRAFDRVLKRNVALKVIRVEASQHEKSRARFEREIKATAAMSHPNVIRILDYGVTRDNVVYFAMDLLTGKDLAALVSAEGPLDPARAVALVEQAARALAHAHARGVIHRDVKPSNLFVCDDGDESEHVKLLDFGIAKLEGEARHITMTEAFIGTPQFAAPETIAGSGASAAADVYSLGAVAFFALVGEPPFDALSRAGVLNAHLVQEAPRVEALRPSVPKEVADIVARALVKDPGGRYASAHAMAIALRHALWRMRGESLESEAAPDDVRLPPRARTCDTETADDAARPARDLGSALARPREA
jgi:tRNA A-37 threonylcarbamoyl transferase component Bud32